jgi:hypothetical protein
MTDEKVSTTKRTKAEVEQFWQQLAVAMHQLRELAAQYADEDRALLQRLRGTP